MSADLGDISDISQSWVDMEFDKAVNNEKEEYALIPDDVKAPAQINKMEDKEYNGEHHINIMYKLVDGAYKGRVVFQKLKVFNRDDQGQKHRGKLANLYIACDVPKPGSLPSSTLALGDFVGSEVGLCIGIFNGYQCIKWFTKLGDNFEIDNKKVLIQSSSVESSSCGSSGSSSSSILIDDEIPF